MVDVKRCKRCVMTSLRPHIDFQAGICSACRNAKTKKEIDWREREKQLRKILDEHRSKDGSLDCIIPVSGGKDSHFQVIKMLEYRMHPLCVTAKACKSTELGKENLENLIDLGVEHILYSIKPSVYKKLTKIGFTDPRIFDNCYPCHSFIFCIASKISTQMEPNIPLIVWGESSAREYGGNKIDSNKPYLDREWLIKYGTINGILAEDFIGYEGLTKSDLRMLTYPTDSELKRVGTVGIFLGNFIQWDVRGRQLDIVKKYGFKTKQTHVPGSYLDHENLDCGFVDIHDHLMFQKFGFGRASSQCSIDIRNGRLSREEALKIVKERDGKMERMEEFCDFIGITTDVFWEVSKKCRRW